MHKELSQITFSAGVLKIPSEVFFVATMRAKPDVLRAIGYACG